MGVQQRIQNLTLWVKKRSRKRTMMDLRSLFSLYCLQKSERAGSAVVKAFAVSGEASSVEEAVVVAAEDGSTDPEYQEIDRRARERYPNK